MPCYRISFADNEAAHQHYLANGLKGEREKKWPNGTVVTVRSEAFNTWVWADNPVQVALAFPEAVIAGIVGGIPPGDYRIDYNILEEDQT
jgi:hypothetical protein